MYIGYWTLNKYYLFIYLSSHKRQQQNTAHTSTTHLQKICFPASLVALLANSEQINHPSSNHIYTKSTPNHIHHYAPSVTLTSTTHISLQLHPHTHHMSPLDVWTDPAGVTALMARWTEKLAGGPQVGSSDSPPH